MVYDRGTLLLIGDSLQLHGVPVVKANISGFNSRADAESKTPYTLGFNSQRLSNYEFLKYSKYIRKGRGALRIVPIAQEAGWAPGPVWTGRKNSPPPGFDPRTVESVASRYTDYATRSTACL